MQLFLYILALLSVILPFSISFFTQYRAFGHFDLSVAITFLIGAYGFVVLTRAGYEIMGIIIGTALAMTFGSAILGLLIRPLLNRETPPLGLTLSTLGIYIVGVNVLALLYGNQLQRPTYSSISALLDINGAILSTAQAWLMIASLASFCAFWLVLYGSRIGRCFRAISDSSNLAHALGLPAFPIVLVLTTANAGLVGLAGVLVAADVGVQPTSAFSLIIPALAGVFVFSGQTINQVAAGSVAVAFADEASTYFFGQQWSELTVFAVVATVLAGRRLGFYIPR